MRLDNNWEDAWPLSKGKRSRMSDAQKGQVTKFDLNLE